ncbi:acylphosphatase [Pseudodesulfovibrio mercurii]|uniref:acylphosphatase n=1 Tax=Pseudodesulfovibrio mercurii TaxID=641491 RepID=F0JJT1_9BACT|nr:acylphosphatase [Pseudodesulfovibrio mercurii]EGB16180.1 acylphosphatase [Pseudodesulfovibrio mercurii]
MLSYTCVVEGKVTGGNFQSWVQDLAQQLGLKGWVRNIADHKAEILIQGDAEKFAAFREHLKNEAPIVDKKNITCGSLDHDKTYDVFSIRG